MKKEPNDNQVSRNPREFMRARHPDLFSDSTTDETISLPRPVFEYHLDTLTSRKQEYEFEHFCRKLAEKELCPNLRVQTGPTGGGDSKVDSETYPVAEEISERWWTGDPSAGTERWAFAFSAKKAWKGKVKADVENIISTGRDYKRIYFFTNQFASDKERSKIEDEIFKKFGIPLHIIDRAWITEKVYENGHLDLAISTLLIEGARTEARKKKGPRDSTRQAELEELDRQVADPTKYQGARYQLVEDCLESAILARSLERPRSEVESRFIQADRLAKDLNYPQQRARIAYNRAWTAYWWYEDYRGFSERYEELEQLLAESTTASELDRLLTLWQLLLPSLNSRRISPDLAKYEERTLSLTETLKKIADDSARPNNSLQAQTGLAIIKMTQVYQGGSTDEKSAVWEEFSRIVDASEGLGAYPIEQLANLGREVGSYIDCVEFDTFYEKVIDVVRMRRSEGEAGEAYYERGMQKLKQGKPYEAIQWVGRAEELLVKEEYQDELIMALAVSSYAYESVGLLWAARNKILTAAERSMAAFHKAGEFTYQALLSLKRLAWIELQIGRIPHALRAMHLAHIVTAHLKLSGERLDALKQELFAQEGVLGIHLLNVPIEELPSISRLPDALERQGLVMARMALLFALGHEKVIIEEKYVPDDKSSDEIKEFFENWVEQPASKDIPTVPTLVNGEKTLLRSVILGSELRIEVQNNPTSFGIAESLLGVLESFLATSDEDDLLPHREVTTIEVKSSETCGGMPKVEFFDEDSSRIEIQHKDKFSFSSAEEIQAFTKWLRDTAISILSQMFVIRDIEPWLNAIAGEERAFSRSLILGDVLTTGRNLFGDGPVQVEALIDPDCASYDLLRAQHWRGRDEDKSSSEEPKEPLKWGEGNPPEELIEKGRLKHTDRRVMSPIDTPLWDKAKWRGTFFAISPEAPPFLGFIFTNGVFGQAIFKSWLRRWSDGTADRELQVTIVRGISKANPAHYAVRVGPNFDQLDDGSDSKAILTVSRIQRMEPATSENLNGFLSAYKKFGCYFLLPAEMSSPPQVFDQFCLPMRQIRVREAWEISENDPDMVVLWEDDDPIIPAVVVDPPVKKALEKIRGSKKS